MDRAMEVPLGAKSVPSLVDLASPKMLEDENDQKIDGGCVNQN